ncbi:MAG TPA: molybdenum cofactor biosynthesis protein MoaE [Chloroflexota bacterium]|nr:molybdenum cofactor biosynthesis protein MoaE [Chloroflexota bacterium]
MFRITSEPIDVEALYRAVLRDRDGAVVTFHGVVREYSDSGRAVRYLEYEAYPEMAEAQMRTIGAEIKRRWDVDDVAMVHRIGRLEIGEASVVIAVAAPHRGEAFDACEYAIDTLKATVPIWKKEVFADGEVWVGLQS